ncbi:MAG TPA: gliding motility lipoprotein GldH [Mucilaginibacter sp.]|jgi:gliding motility-associated lipoprotein GldH|nr:gliding motility lipoprotein GldH [Mucilaginibacter sp.]
MNKGVTILGGLFFLLLTSLLSSCSGGNTIIDKNNDVENHNWTYVNKFRYDVVIDEISHAYNIAINLRVTGNYKYSNMFILLTQVGPDKKSTTSRFELKLADKDGAWLGQGSGNLYSFQQRVLTNYKFSGKGTYTFYIEQNMRDNPLREVSDVGLRVEKAAP